MPARRPGTGWGLGTECPAGGQDWVLSAWPIARTELRLGTESESEQSHIFLLNSQIKNKVIKIIPDGPF